MRNIFQYTKVKIGADPEFFLKLKGTGEVYPAVGLIGGTKNKPNPIDKKGHALQEDNVMVEFCIPPARTEKAFVDSCHFVLDYVSKKMTPKFDISIQASATFNPEYLQSEQANVFGCEPDYNAWTLTINEFARDSKNKYLRTAGGHIHIGYENPEPDNQVALIRAMDLFVGVPSVVLDGDSKRRILYGKAGAFRPKDYGVEFRTPSNFWLQSKELTAWAYRNTHKAINFLNEGKEIAESLGARIQNTINTNDTSSAKDLCKEYGLLPA